jgi:hypothetical protein
MGDLNPNQHIYDVLQDIGRGRFRIPNIQRGYEWNHERVTKPLDSIMSGYPIGAIMVWRPTEEIAKDIMYRRFVAHYNSTQNYLSDEPHPSDDDAYLVLDGQQRLQSLYLSFFGSYDGMRVYLQIDRIPTDVGDDTDYGFEFLTLTEAQQRPEMVHLAEIIKLDADTRFDFVEQLAEQLCVAIKDEKEREVSVSKKRAAISRNIERFTERFNVKQSLLFQQAEKRHNYDHVLEIFERVNSGGMVLSKSDLLFSTLKLKLSDMERNFTDTLDFLNQGDRHNFNADFLIKASLVVFGQGAKYEVSKLRNADFVAAMASRYSELSTCLRQMLAWLDDVAAIKCARFLRSQLALIPLLDYMMLSGQHDKPDGDNGLAMRQYLYMVFFLRVYSRAPDSVLDQIHGRLVKAVDQDKSHFPIEILRDFITNRQKVPFQIQEYNFQEDADLMINIADGGVLQIDPTDDKRHPKDLRLEVDHIFPRAPLTEQGLGDVVNHVGNYRLIVMPANRRKSAHMPDATTDFFGRRQSEVDALYLATIQNLSRDTFVAFRNARASLIRERVEQFLGLPLQ